MAILWVDGFDHYGDTEAEMLNGSYAQITDTGLSGGTVELKTDIVRTGTHSLFFKDTSTPGGGGVTTLRKSVPAGSVTELGVGFAAYLPQLPVTNTASLFLQFRDITNTAQITIGVLTTGALRVYKGTQTGTVLGTTSGPVISAEAWHHIECYAVFNDTTGSVKIRVNNVEVLSLTGQDTVNTALVECSQIAFFSVAGSPAGFASGGSYYIDDLYLYDTTGSHANAYPVGDLQAMLLTATADTAEADFDKSTGTDGFALIDEATPNDADYISADAAGDRSDFTLTDLPTDVNYVETLFSHVRALKSDAGTAQLQQSFMQGANQSAGADRPLTTSATYWFDNHPTDPSTSAKWSRTGVNSANIRFDRTA